MILLGSVNRHDLVRMIEKHIGREKRLEVAVKCYREAENRAREAVEEELIKQQQARRPSRFEVIPAPDVFKLRALANNEMLPAQAKKSKETINNVSQHSLPAKSILKKTNSFSTRQCSVPFSLDAGYSAISGSDEAIKKSATMQDITPNMKHETTMLSHSIASSNPSISKRVQLVCIKRSHFQLINIIITHVFLFFSRSNGSSICHWKSRRHGNAWKCKKPSIYKRRIYKSIRRHSSWLNARPCSKYIACFRCWASIMHM